MDARAARPADFLGCSRGPLTRPSIPTTHEGMIVERGGSAASSAAIPAVAEAACTHGTVDLAGR